jgi:hypothetical protein
MKKIQHWGQVCIKCKDKGDKGFLSYYKIKFFPNPLYDENDKSTKGRNMPKYSFHLSEYCLNCNRYKKHRSQKSTLMDSLKDSILSTE